ncbi:response regulator transcription factor [Maridesulfovibrio frigidus]|uniref:response regulator transcription factor n=1 Tax=Maridesulfovibrio frigidus TaxID=340956 RepID=UPI0004E22EC6|nr:response regulator transcription factor [Maridesulfovibrio frigidus]
MKILIVDDDRKLCDVLKRGLKENAYVVDCAYDGKEGECYADTHSYDLIILDVMLPSKDGLAICKDLRRKNITTPILMLTARDTVEDRVRGLDTGADDYLTKPFAFAELLARARALLRRDNPSKSSKLSVGELLLDTKSREVHWKSEPIELTTKEYVILEYLMRNPNAVVTRTMIESHAWDYDLDSISNLVDVYIRRIRQKIDPEQGKQIIQTVRGAGYRMKS